MEAALLEEARSEFLAIMDTTAEILEKEVVRGEFGRDVETWNPILTYPAHITMERLPVPIVVAGKLTIVYLLEAVLPHDAAVSSSNRVRIGEIDYEIASGNFDKPDRLTLHLSIQRAV